MRANLLPSTNQKRRLRKGRGIAAGRGKTAGRGTKGQNSRSGGKVRPGFEGGQTPLYMRLPKLPGFRSRRQPVVTVTLHQISRLKERTISKETLLKYRLINRLRDRVKLVAKGDLETAKTIHVDAASKQAEKLVAKAGGKILFTSSAVKQPPKKP